MARDTVFKPPRFPASPQVEADPKDSAKDAEVPSLPKTTAGHLSHDANFYRHQNAGEESFGRPLPFGDEDDIDDDGIALGAILPSARMRAHPDLEEPRMRPPEFLSPLDAMKDIYMRVKGRASPRTTDLLGGVDLEDMLATLSTIFADESLAKSPAARVRESVARPLGKNALGPEFGPLLDGLGDPRLTEPWRLFLEGWDIWHPDDQDDGVELFWEGEAEGNESDVLEIVQSLGYASSELTLTTRVNALEDVLTFDGGRYYRLRKR